MNESGICIGKTLSFYTIRGYENFYLSWIAPQMRQDRERSKFCILNGAHGFWKYGVNIKLSMKMCIRDRGYSGPRPKRGDHSAGGFRPANRPLYLWRLFKHREKMCIRDRGRPLFYRTPKDRMIPDLQLEIIFQPTAWWLAAKHIFSSAFFQLDAFHNGISKYLYGFLFHHCTHLASHNKIGSLLKG